ncbi:MAG TPA: hydantoinase/oxoprolinase family protein [Clostridia bacterium]|nr:hydantoinase/oxoprolinase family protein [Clostridia bacterium]
MIVGLDMGGTHIDAAIIKDGKVLKTAKQPTDRNNLFESIWSTLNILLEDCDSSKIKRINLSTTVSTNAIVEEKTSPVGVIIQSGPGLNNKFLACGDENIFISGYVDHRGKVVKGLNLTEIQNGVESFKKKDIQHCAVITKFSTRNPNHEIEINSTINKNFSHVTMGHTLSGKLNFPRRVFTSYLNSAVYDTFRDFALYIGRSLEKEGIDAPVFILKADGGTMNLDASEKKPVETILSGPAASFMGINAMLDTDKDAVLLDIGGTTTDIFFLVGGVPLFEPLGIKIGPYNTLVRSIYSVSIGLGGDSSINIEDKDIEIGPKREGVPYAFGGPRPTPTDAMIVLGRIEEGDKERAFAAMEILSKQLNLSVEETAKTVLKTMALVIKNKVNGLLQEINSKPVYTIKELLYGKKVEPGLINVIGGPANILAPILEEEFNLPCRYPQNYDVANAVGAALAKTTTEINMVADTSQQTLSVPELGIYEKISGNYTLKNARERATELLRESAISLGAEKDTIETEIVEENSFNMVRGFYTSGKNIRIKAQIKPGLIQELRGETND